MDWPWEFDEPRHAELREALGTLLRLLDVGNHPETLDLTPTKRQYLAAIADLRIQDFGEALEKFIDVILSDRYYDDDGSRKACRAIFKFLGEEHPITQKHRREFSSALYV